MIDIGEWKMCDVTGRDSDTIHHCLRASRRRLVAIIMITRVINEQSPKEDLVEVSVSTLAREIVAIENNITPSQATGKKYHNTYTALSQTHLPLLNDVSAIEFDRDRKIVSPGDNLIPLTIIAIVSSNISRLIFQSTSARLIVPGKYTMPDELGK